MSPLVSILIPVYNAEKYIGEAIQSAVNQTWPEKEVIVVDDGSDDNSLTIAKQFAGQHIRVFSQKNKGPSAARNYALSQARGEYIQFLDADDLLSTNKIEDQINLLMNCPGNICMGPTIHFFNDDAIDKKNIDHDWMQEGSNNPVDFLIKLYGGDVVGPKYGGMVAIHSWLCPKNVLDKAGLWNEELTVDDDGEYFCRVILASEGIKYAFNGISFYRKYKNGNSMSSKTGYEANKSMLKSAKLKTKHLLHQTANPLAKTALSRVLHANAINFYPQYKDMYKEALFLAKTLDSNLKVKPYNSGIKKVISLILGWKSVRYIQYLNSNLSHK
jgi:glycosyltransferase involved in cell wall biosynthesis